MPISTQKLEEIRRILADLNPDSEGAYAVYQEQRRIFIAVNEEGNLQGKSRVYRDSKGKPTVGIGFWMGSEKEEIQRQEQQWLQAFAALKTDARPDFQQVRDGKLALTQQQIDILFNYSLNVREKELKNTYKENWSLLALNERLAIEDAYYNGSKKLVGVGSDFLDAVKLYAVTKDPIEKKNYLRDALWELQRNSNKENSVGIQNRRNVQARMLNSYYPDLQHPPTPEHYITALRTGDLARFQQPLKQEREELLRDREAIIIAALNAHLGALERQVAAQGGLLPVKEEPYLSEAVARLSDHYRTMLETLMQKQEKQIEAALGEYQTQGLKPSEMKPLLQTLIAEQLQEVSRKTEAFTLYVNQQMDMLRQPFFGIREFIWQTRQDDKVRATHAAHHGKRFFWEVQWADDYPGLAFGCRCRAEPVWH